MLVLTISYISLYTEDQDASCNKDDIPLTLRIRATVAAALGAAAARAKLLADQEDREVEHLLAIIIGTQVGQIFSLFLFILRGLGWSIPLNNYCILFYGVSMFVKKLAVSH